MKLTKTQIESVIDKILSLPEEYWRERFEDIDLIRQAKNDKEVANFFILAIELEEKLSDLIASYFGKYSEEDVIDFKTFTEDLTDTEKESLINSLNQNLEEAKKIGITFDRDISSEIEGLKKKDISRLDALILRAKSEIELLYGKYEKYMTDHFVDTIEDLYYGTLYEVYHAAGYTPSKQDKLDLSVLTAILNMSWRATNETFDEVLWRYKRTFEFDIGNILKQRAYLGATFTLTTDDINRVFNRIKNELKRLLNTDSTYFSTLAQKEGYEYLYIDKVVYTAIHDERLCSTCADLDRTEIDVDSIMSWVNAPPIHYFCRCVLIPIIVALNYLTGEVEELEGDDMAEWFDLYVG